MRVQHFKGDVLIPIPQTTPLPGRCKVLFQLRPFTRRELLPLYFRNHCTFAPLAVSFGANKIKFQITFPITRSSGVLLAAKILKHGRSMVMQ